MDRPDAAPPGFLSPQIRRGRYLFLDPQRRGALSLACVGWEECRADFVIDRPSFRYHAVELLAGGQWDVRRGSRWVPAAAGTVVAYGPGRHGGIRARGDGPHFKYFADFKGAGAAAAVRRAGLGRSAARLLAEPRHVAELYEQMAACAELPPAHRAPLADLLLRALLERLGAEKSGEPGSAPQPRKVFARCRAYLLEHYPDAGGIGAAARACHVAPEYFSRLFRQYAGQTAARFLAQLRVDHAAKLMLRSNVTVKAAAAAVGYNDPYHFSRVFKRIHGVAPRTFARKQH